MSHFCLLSDPTNYVAHNWDLIADEPARVHWLDLFASHFEQMLKHAGMQYGRKVTRAVGVAREQFTKAIAELRANPAALDGKLNILELCRLRERVLRANTLYDPFGYIKIRENTSAAKLYPQVVRKLHSMDVASKWLHLVECVFAGNIFDLGATATMNLAAEPGNFLGAVENTKPRPWRVDDYDKLAADLASMPPCKWSKVLIFVDNAGSDFILGVMPLARELALSGAKIVLAANEIPSLNDITADETVATVERLAALDDDLGALIAGGMFEVVSTGTDIPLIDLSQVSDELNEAAADAELIILEGQGRAVESNFDAKFSVDTLKIALLKDALVAQRIGGELYDCVCRYEPKA